MRHVLLLALLAVTLVAADPAAPDLATTRAAFAIDAPQRASLFRGLELRDDGRIRVAVGSATVGEILTVDATDIANGESIREAVDVRQCREPYLIPLPDGRVATARVIRPSIGAAVIVVIGLAMPAKAAP